MENNIYRIYVRDNLNCEWLFYEQVEGWSAFKAIRLVCINLIKEGKMHDNVITDIRHGIERKDDVNLVWLEIEFCDGMYTAKASYDVSRSKTTRKDVIDDK